MAFQFNDLSRRGAAAAALVSIAAFGNAPLLAQPPATDPASTPAVTPAPSAASTPSASGTPQAIPGSTPPRTTGSAGGALSVPPKSLPAQRLHPASFPLEAEVRCGTTEPCLIGLTRGFVLGGDVFNMATVPLFKQYDEPGAWLFLDGFLGYQFLQGVDGTFWSSAGVGYRTFSYRDSNGRELGSRGWTFRIHHVQEINPVYSQGLNFELYAGQQSFSANAHLYDVANFDNAWRAINRFYTFSQRSPQIRLGFPAHVEFVNWKSTHVDLPNHLRGYVLAEPFYKQNEFHLDDIVRWREKNFGLRLGYATSYEAPLEKSGRYALLAAAGFDLATAQTSAEFERPIPTLTSRDPKLDKRRTIGYFVNLEASYRF